MDTLETTEELSVKALRERMAKRGVREYELAAVAEVHPSNLAAMLRGRAPMGERVRAKIEAGIEKLGLNEDTAVEVPSAFTPPTFHVRKPTVE